MAVERARRNGLHQGLSPDGVRDAVNLTRQLNRIATSQQMNQNALGHIALGGTDGLMQRLIPSAFSSAMNAGSGSGTAAATAQQRSTPPGQRIALAAMGIPSSSLDQTINMFLGDGASSNAFTQNLMGTLFGDNPDGYDPSMLALIASSGGGIIGNFERAVIQDMPALLSVGENRDFMGALNAYNILNQGNLDDHLKRGEDIVAAAGTKSGGFWDEYALRLKKTPLVGPIATALLPDTELDLPEGMTTIKEGETIGNHIRNNLGAVMANMLIHGTMYDVSGGVGAPKSSDNMARSLVNGFVDTSRLGASGGKYYTAAQRAHFNQGAELIMGLGINAWEQRNNPEAWEKLGSEINEWLNSNPQMGHMSQMFLGYIHDQVNSLATMFEGDKGGLTSYLDHSDLKSALVKFHTDKEGNLNEEKYSESEDVLRKAFEKGDGHVAGFYRELGHTISNHAMTQEKLQDGLAASMGVMATVKANYDIWKTNPTEENAYAVMAEGVGGAVEELYKYALENNLNEQQLAQFEKLLKDPNDPNGGLLNGDVIMQKVSEYVDAQINGDVPEDLLAWNTNPIARAIVQGVAPVFLNLKQRSLQEQQWDLIEEENLDRLDAEADYEKEQDELDRLLTEEIKRRGG